MEWAGFAVPTSIWRPETRPPGPKRECKEAPGPPWHCWQSLPGNQGIRVRKVSAQGHPVLLGIGAESGGRELYIAVVR